ncbi:MAG TPA: MFS transporter [Gammaproteobacteria bacterium]|nr:MFS transporter [Gammaproteobacteria bacterium]
MTSIPDAAEERAYAGVTRRLLPFLGACYLVAYLDRVNVSFAKLHMLGDLGMSEAAYGFGAGVFFLGYFLFELPSNLALHRIGARVWIARIMVTWGIVSAAMAFTGTLAELTGLGTDTVFYALRFLLGVAEAGFVPGVLLYLNYWYPSHRQSRAVAWLLAAQPLAFVIGAPVSGAIMESFGGVAGLYDWQWLFLLEAAPAIVLAVGVLLYLDNGIADAAWLTQDERRLLEERLALEARTKRDHSLRDLLAVKPLWLFSLIYLLIVTGVYGINFWLPSIIQQTGVRSILSIGWITALSYLVSAVLAVLAARHAERHNEKRWHAAGAAALGGAALALSATFAGSTWLTVACVTLASTGGLLSMSLFWSFPGSILVGAGVAAGLAAVNSVGNLGGFIGPYLLGGLTHWLGSSTAGIAVLGGVMVAAGALIAATCKDYGVLSARSLPHGR